ncbi:valine--tRNA ligase [Candidatus Gottesmanbacteria bacterium]|nr:valine--tRNA ligase [Candidatus Gottesmanbacteria bacterium]
MLDKAYKPNEVEEKIYKMWEDGRYFTPRLRSGQAPGRKPFTILLPLPNANDPMHMGHAMFTVEDIMVRYHRMLGEPTLWLPGGDHAGIETQFVFEKHLAKKGQSRFDFDRNTLYQMIWDFCDQNKNLNRDQMKRLGFSLDWSRYHYSLEPEIVEKVLKTFKKLHEDGLIYRGKKIVNFCPHCGTTFSDLEVDKVERIDPLYFVRYKKTGAAGYITVATTRPEPIFIDTHLAVNPKDKKNNKLIGSRVVNPLTGREMEIIGDDFVDPKFGTGIVKLTPAHDFADFEVAQKHHLPIIDAITKDGRIVPSGGKYAGMKIKAAREQVVQDLTANNLIEKVDHNYQHAVGVCYRCKTIIEPLTIEQWFIKTKPLAAYAIKAVKTGKTKIVPKKRFEKMYFQWLENIRDWNISRQIVWGPRVPAWYCLTCNPHLEMFFINKNKERVNGPYKDLSRKFSYEEIIAGLQTISAPIDATYSLTGNPCQKCGGHHIVQETDTLDTWFLSGQWPLSTLGFNSDNPQKSSANFKYFYPTSVLDTMWDILFFWVARMMMFGLYLTSEVPFKVVHIHARVVDKFGQKMSKSKGNVIDPITVTEKYGADALRMALVLGVAPASDIALSEEKIVGMRNFCNKLWNIARFIEMFSVNKPIKFIGAEMPSISTKDYTQEKAWCFERITETTALFKEITKLIESFNFGQASERLYQYTWHTFADMHLETAKNWLKNENENSPYIRGTLLDILERILKLWHPFIPFVTEEIWDQMKLRFANPPKKPLIIEQWPK